MFYATLFLSTTSLSFFYLKIQGVLVISGGVKFALDVGSERFEVNTPNHGIDYTNGQQHEVRMWRTGENGKVVHIQVKGGPISPLGIR